MAAAYNFRSALNGFNREDVVRYLEYINAKNANQTSQLKNDLENAEKEILRLRKLEGLQAELEALQVRCDALEQEKRDLNGQIEVLQQELVAESQKKAQVVNRSEEELEAYRRAERVERQARERTEALCQQANGILADAGIKVDEAAANLGLMAEQVNQQLHALQQAVVSSKAVLQEASIALCSVRPKDEA